MGVINRLHWGKADLRCESKVCRFVVALPLCIERKLRSAGIAGLLMVVEAPWGGGRGGLGSARPCLQFGLGEGLLFAVVDGMNRRSENQAFSSVRSAKSWHALAAKVASASNLTSSLLRHTHPTWQTDNPRRRTRCLTALQRMPHHPRTSPRNTASSRNYSHIWTGI